MRPGGIGGSLLHIPSRTTSTPSSRRAERVPPCAASANAAVGFRFTGSDHAAEATWHSPLSWAAGERLPLMAQIALAGSNAKSTDVRPPTGAPAGVAKFKAEPKPDIASPPVSEGAPLERITSSWGRVRSISRRSRLASNRRAAPAAALGSSALQRRPTCDYRSVGPGCSLRKFPKRHEDRCNLARPATGTTPQPTRCRPE